MSEYRAITVKSSSFLEQIKTNVKLTTDSSDIVPTKEWIALWDTGANHTCITDKIINEYNLKPNGRSFVTTANGTVETESFIVSVWLPNGVVIPDIDVYRISLDPSLDLVIGMDIILYGDFAITNKDGKTTFSFRYPSVEEIDFVKEYNF